DSIFLHVVPDEADVACFTLHKTHHQAKQRRFSRSVVADNSYYAPRVDTYVNGTDGERVDCFSDILQFNRLHWVSSPFFSICRRPSFGCPVSCSCVAMPFARPVPTPASPSHVSLQRSWQNQHRRQTSLFPVPI